MEQQTYESATALSVLRVMERQGAPPSVQYMR